MTLASHTPSLICVFPREDATRNVKITINYNSQTKRTFYAQETRACLSRARSLMLSRAPAWSALTIWRAFIAVLFTCCQHTKVYFQLSLCPKLQASVYNCPFEGLIGYARFNLSQVCLCSDFLHIPQPSCWQILLMSPP